MHRINSLVKICFIGCCLFVAVGLRAQKNKDNNNNQPKSQEYGELKLTRDSFIDDHPSYFSAFDIQNLKPIKSIEDSIIIFYDPAKPQHSEQIHLGNTGSAVYDPETSPREQLGLRLGNTGFDLYKTTIESFQFLNIKAGYTELNFSQTNQSNTRFNTLFSRNFSDERVNFVFRYHRISQEGIYLRQTNRNTFISSGLHTKSKNNRRTTSLMFSSNLITQADNGGITSDTLLREPASRFRRNVPIVYNDHVTKDHDIHYALFNTYHLKPPKDSSSIYLYNLLQYSKTSYFREDRIPTAALHPVYFQNSDSLQNALQHALWKTEFGLNIRFNGPLPLALRSGLTLRNNSIWARQFRERIPELVWTTAMQLKPSRSIRIDATNILNFSALQNEFSFRAKLAYLPHKDWALYTHLGTVSQQPEYLERTIILNDKLVSQQSLDNTKYFVLRGSIHYKPLQLTLAYRSGLLSDYIYWNSEQRIAQYDATLSIQSIYLRNKLKWKIFSLESDLNYNIVNKKDILRIPEFRISGLFYLDGSLFKKNLNFKTGFFFRFLGRYQALSFYPTLGVFYQADASPYTSYPDLSYFAEFRINQFKFFVLIENLNSYRTTLPEIEVDRYPQFDGAMRIGFRWIFRQ